MYSNQRYSNLYVWTATCPTIIRTFYQLDKGHVTYCDRLFSHLGSQRAEFNDIVDTLWNQQDNVIDMSISLNNYVIEEYYFVVLNLPRGVSSGI